MFEFALISDLNNTVTGVNSSVTFGDGQSFSVNNFNLTSSTLFFVQNNYSRDGDYTINVSASSPNITDWQRFDASIVI